MYVFSPLCDFLTETTYFSRLTRLARRTYVALERAYSDLTEMQCAIRYSAACEAMTRTTVAHRSAHYEMLLQEVASWTGLSTEQAHYQIGCNWPRTQVPLQEAFLAMRGRA